MKILITGSEGYIGKLVAQTLLSLNHEVICVDFKLGSDIANIKNVTCDVLVHLAAFISVVESYEQASSYYENNCAKYHKLLELNGNKFSRVIYASSVAVYNENKEVLPLSVYGSTKYEGELITNRYTSNNVILRFGNPVGVDVTIHNASDCKKSYPNLLWILANCKVNSKKFGLHNTVGMKRDFYPVFWIPQVISKVLDTDTVGVHHIGSGIATDVATLVKKLCLHYNIEYELINSPLGTSKGFNPIDSNYLLCKAILENEFTSYNAIDFCINEMSKYMFLL